MLAGGLAYIVVNVGSVTLITALARGRGDQKAPWKRSPHFADNDLIAWFWGVIFTLFAAQYST